MEAIIGNAAHTPEEGAPATQEDVPGPQEDVSAPMDLCSDQTSNSLISVLRCNPWISNADTTQYSEDL